MALVFVAGGFAFNLTTIALPLIGALHAGAGFPLVLGAAAVFGGLVFGAACLMAVAMRPRGSAPAAAE